MWRLARRNLEVVDFRKLSFLFRYSFLGQSSNFELRF